MDALEQLLGAVCQERPTPLVRALGLAFHWQRLLDEQLFSSITEIAAAEGLDLGRASRISRLATLAPDIVDTAVSGNEQVITLETLGRQALFISWDKQRRGAHPA